MRSTILKWIITVGLMLGCGTAQISEAAPASAASEPGQDYVANEILVKFKPGISKEVREQVRQRLGALSQEDAYGSDYQAIRVKEGTIREMVDLYLRHAVVEYAEPNYIYDSVDLLQF